MPAAPGGEHGWPALTSRCTSVVVVGGDVSVVVVESAVAGGRTELVVPLGADGVVDIGSTGTRVSTSDGPLDAAALDVADGDTGVVVAVLVPPRTGAATGKVTRGALVGTSTTMATRAATLTAAPTPATAIRWLWLLRHHQLRTGPGSDRPRTGISLHGGDRVHRS
jgi:hypothetical protein